MKTYLKDLTPEEIIKRLKNGEVVKIEHSGSYIKMIDGITVRFYPLHKPYINATINLDDKDFYFETEEPLTFEEGKFYKTREGKKAYISRITTTYFYGIITGKTSLDTWNLKGMHWYDKSPHKNDLISKWED